MHHQHVYEKFHTIHFCSPIFSPLGHLQPIFWRKNHLQPTLYFLYSRYIEYKKIIEHVLRFTIHIYQAYLIHHKSICTLFIFHKLGIIQNIFAIPLIYILNENLECLQFEFWRERVECLRYGVNFSKNVVWGLELA